MSQRLLTSFISLLFVYLSFGAQAEVHNNKKGLTIGVTQEFDTLNPLNAQMIQSREIFSLTTRALVTLDENLKWVPVLVKKIPTVQNGLAKVITEKGEKKIISEWEIKDQMQWGDGKPLTGNDVLFTWQLALSPLTGTSSLRHFQTIESITVNPKNPKKFAMKFKSATFDFYHLGDFFVLPKHLEEPVFKKYGKEKEGYVRNSNFVKNPTMPGLSSGPYRVGEVKLGSHITLVKNEKYPLEQAKIERITFKLIPNTSTLEANLRSGTINMIGRVGLTLDQALALDKKMSSDKWAYQVNYQPALTYEHIDLNLENEFLKDVRVRQALVFAINRDHLSKAIFEGKQKPALHNIAPGDPWFTDNPKQIVKYKTSKRKARNLLSAAGWKLNKKTGYRYKDGKKLHLEFMTTSGNKTRELVQVFLKNEWKAVGIDITIKNQPPRVYFGDTIRKAKFPGMAMFAWTGAPERNQEIYLHSRFIPREENGFAGSNISKWNNAKTDRLLSEVATEFDPKKRKAIMAKVLYEYTKDVPVIPLYYRTNVTVTPKTLTNYKQSRTLYPATNFAEKWEFNQESRLQ